MTISRVGVATGTTSAAVPAHNIGDAIVIFAFNGTSTTVPTVPAGFQTILTATGTSCAAALGFKIATATNDASGTWTNATALVCHVYRSGLYSTGGSLFIGGSASSSSINNTVNYPALTMIHGDNTSWALGFGGVSNLTETISTAPSGMTNQSLETAAATQAAGHDTNGTVLSWSSTNATTTGAAGNSVSCTVELIENQPGTDVNNLAQHLSFGYDMVASGDKEDNLTYDFDPTLAGNGLVVAVAYPNGATPAITDNKSNTWPASGAAGTATVDAGAGNMVLQVFVLKSAATGTSQIIVNFGGNPQQPVKVWITQLYNITGTINGNVSAAAVNSGGIISAGSFTPTNNNANGGNLILCYMSNSTPLGLVTNPALIVTDTNFVLNDADISGAAANTFPSASQFYLQAASAAVTPRFYLNAGGTDTYNIIAVALSVGVQGTPAPVNNPGGAPWISRVCYFQGFSAVNFTWLLQIPGRGNCGTLESFLNGTGVQTSASATDNDGVSWTQVTFTPAAQTPYLRPNITSARFNRTLGVSVVGSGNLQAIYRDIANCAVSPLVAHASANAGSGTGVSSEAHQPDITPPQANCLTLCFAANTTGPTMAITSPSGAVFDSPQASVAKFVAGISATTMTVASTTWGAINSAATGVISGPGVSTGTNITAGTGPYTVQPSQTVSAGTTMFQSTEDNNTFNFGNGAGHYFNGSSLATQNWTWDVVYNLSGLQGSAIILAGAPAAGGQTQVTSRLLMGVGL